MFNPLKPTSDMPRSRKDKRLLANIEGALEQARAHLNVVRHNPLAVKHQEIIIARYEAQLRELTEEWLDT
jgi:hypothetical protein